MVGRKGAYRVCMGDLMERDNMEDVGIDGRILLQCILK